MYSEKFEKVYQTFQEKYYKTDLVISARQLKPITGDRKNIGIIKFDDDYDCFDKELCWYITSAGIKFSRLYLIIPNVEKLNTFEMFKFNQLITLFSDITVKIVTDNQDAEIIKAILENKHNDIYILDPHIVYTSLNVPYQYGTKTVYNLHKDLNFTRRHSYYKSCMQYDKHDDTKHYQHTIVTEPDIRNVLGPDFFIPAYTIGDDFVYNDKVSISSNFYYYFFMHDVKIYYFEQTLYNCKFDLKVHDSELLTLICNEKEQEKIDKWYYNYPYYKASALIANSVNKIIDIAFVSMVAPETIVESILQLSLNCPFKIRNIFILDNVPEKNYESHMYKHHAVKIENYDNVKILYNNIGQLFEQREASQYDILNDGIFGQPLFEQSIKYLTENSDADYLFILDDKIILNNDIEYDPELVWNGNSTKNNIDRYINVFNIAKMKELGIHYTNFKEFSEKLSELNLPTKKISLKNQILLPKDFDKYASVIFRVANTRGQILYNYLLDTYNYRLLNYEDYNGGHPEL